MKVGCRNDLGEIETVAEKLSELARQDQSTSLAVLIIQALPGTCASVINDICGSDEKAGTRLGKHRPSVLTLVSPFLFDLVQGSMHLLVDLIGEPIIRRVVQADLPAQVGRTGDFQERGHGETWSSLCVRGLGQKGSLQWSASRSIVCV